MNDEAHEILPEIDPAFSVATIGRDVPFEERFSVDFVKRTVKVPEDSPVELGWIYDADKNKFSPPPLVEQPSEIDELREQLDALTERLEAEQTFSALLQTTQMRELSHRVAAEEALQSSYQVFLDAATDILCVEPPAGLAPMVKDWYSRGLWSIDQVETALALGQISRSDFDEIAGVV